MSHKILLIISVIFVAACSKYTTKDILRGSEYNYDFGVPVFSFTAHPRVLQDTTVLYVYINLLENSLIYKMKDSVLISKGEILIEVDGARIKSIPIQSEKSEINNYYSYEHQFINEILTINPGNHEIKITVFDSNSLKKITKKVNILIPETNPDDVFFSNIVLSKKNKESQGYQVVNNYDVNSDYDSLRFEYQLINPEGKQINLQATLLKFEYDSKIPRRLSDRNYRRSSLEYDGIRYDESERIQNIKREISAAGSILMEYKFADLPEGNYRFEVVSSTNGGTKNYRARDFSIKSENFPAILNVREAAKPLVYLMNKEPYRKLLSIESDDSLKKAIEMFWLSNIKNTTDAKKVIQLYYERVEYANKNFSNFQEGWKTDPGMVYILFGPPLYTDIGFGEMTWFYSFDSGTSTPHIYFKDVQFGNKRFPFQHFILNRSPNLFSIEYRQIEAWRSGAILKMLEM